MNSDKPVCHNSSNQVVPHGVSLAWSKARANSGLPAVSRLSGFAGVVLMICKSEYHSRSRLECFLP